MTGDLSLFWIKLADRTTRDALARALLERGVGTAVGDGLLDPTADTPNAHAFSARALCLPLHQNLEPIKADYAMSYVVQFFAGAPR